MTLCGSDRLAIISHQPLFRAGLATYLSATKSFDIVFEGSSASEALDAARSVQPDLMLFDPVLTGGRVAVASASSIASANASMRLVILSTSENEDDVTQLLRNGVHGYILKDVQPGELSNAISIVMNGQVYVSSSLGARLVSRALRPTQTSTPVESKLSAREGAILSRAALGSTNKEIAQTFALSEKTVKYYMTNIMKKLQVRNRVEAIVMLRQQTTDEPFFPTSA